MKILSAVFVLASMVILPCWVRGQEKPVPSPAPVSSTSAKEAPTPPTPVTVEEKLAIREMQVELKDIQLQIQDLVTKATDVQSRIRQKVSDLQSSHGCKDCSLDAQLAWIVPVPKPQVAAVKAGGK